MRTYARAISRACVNHNGPLKLVNCIVCADCRKDLSNKNNQVSTLLTNTWKKLFHSGLLDIKKE